MPYNRPTWDLTSVLYAVEKPQEFSAGFPGTVSIDDCGMSTFIASENGLHRILSVAPSARQSILDRLVELTTKAD